MLFTSYKYALFVTLAFCVYYLAARRARATSAEPGLTRPELFLLRSLGRELVPVARRHHGNRVLGGLLLERNESSRKLIVAAARLIDLGALGAFKYYGFSATPSPA